MNLFKKVIVFTDIHFGLRHNSKDHNQDCLDFINWMVSEAKERQVDTCIFMGDLTHHRNTINVQTLNFLIAGMKILNDNFQKVYMIIGNHDMYLRERRDVNSMVITSEFTNIVLVDSVQEIGNVALVPWLVEEEWKE